jgi:hypothetical protein
MLQLLLHNIIEEVEATKELEEEEVMVEEE